MHTLPDGTPAYSFRTRLKDPGTIERITCVTRLAKTPSAALPRVLTANATELRALPRSYVPLSMRGRKSRRPVGVVGHRWDRRTEARWPIARRTGPPGSSPGDRKL